MRKHVLILTTTVAILNCGAIAAKAQAPSAQTSGHAAESYYYPAGSRSDDATRPKWGSPGLLW